MRIWDSIKKKLLIVFLKKKVPLGTIISVLMCFVGICLFYNPVEPLSFQGSVLAFSSAVTFAIYVVMLSNFKLNSATGFLLSFYAALISSVITFVICIVTNTLALPRTLNSLVLCAIFAFMVTTLAVVFFQQGAFIIGGEKTSILSALEPITALIVGFTILGDPIPKITVIIGLLLVVAASILVARFDMKKKVKR